MLSRFTKLRLVDFLYHLADGETKTEVVRQVLAEKADFEPYVTFKRMAVAPTPYLSSNDIYEFMLDNNIDVLPEETLELLKMFDANKDGKLSFSEFLNAILPKDNPELRQKITMRPTYNILEGERLPYEIEYGLARIFEEELKNYKRVRNLKQELSYCYDFTVIHAFKTLDTDGKDYLIPEDIAAFMEDNGKILEDDELKALFRKIDQDLDGKIIYSEFLESLFSSSTTDHSIPKEESVLKKNSVSPRTLKTSIQDTKKFTISPPSNGGLDTDYKDYLIESKIRSLSPKRDAVHEKEIYRTPERSAAKLINKPSLSSKKRSPLKGNEEEEFVRAIKEIINNNKQLENTKNELTLRSDFNIFDAFRFFDIEGKGAYISFQEFQDGLADLSIFPTKEELLLFFRRFDTDNDNFLRFTDFHQIISPKSPEYAQIMVNRKPKDAENEEEIFSVGTKNLFAKVLDLAINNEVEAESIRRRLSRRPLFSLHDAFRAIDKDEQGFITMDNLQEILEQYGIFTTNKDLNMLFERFKGDDGKIGGKISYSDFVKELSPQSLKNSRAMK